MANNELERKIDSLIAIENYISELSAEAEEIRNCLKNELSQRGVEEMEIGSHIVRWIPIVTSRFSAKLFKEKLGEGLYKEFLRESYSRRFTVA